MVTTQNEEHRPGKFAKITQVADRMAYQKYIHSRITLLTSEWPATAAALTEPLRTEANQIFESVIALDGSATMDDVFRLEKTLLRFCSEPELRRRSWQIRSDFRDVAGQAGYDEYMKTRPPDSLVAGISIEDLRSDLLQIQSRTHELYTALVARESVRNILTMSMVGIVLTVMLTVMGLIVYQIKLIPPQMMWWQINGVHKFVTVLMLVVVFGGVGGFMSVLRRLQRDTGDRAHSLMGLLSLRYGYWSIISAPLNGAMFSIILLLLFTSGLLKGAAFPDMRVEPAAFRQMSEQQRVQVLGTTPRVDKPTRNSTEPISTTEDPISLVDFLYNLHPITQKDYAALLIWSFLAGFAEQFVPDALDRLAAQGKK